MSGPNLEMIRLLLELAKGAIELGGEAFRSVAASCCELQEI